MLKKSIENTAKTLENIIDDFQLKDEFSNLLELNKLVYLYFKRYSIIFNSICELCPSFEEKKHLKFLLILSLRSGIEDCLYIIRLKYLKSKPYEAEMFAKTLMSEQLKRYIDFYSNLDVLLNTEDISKIIDNINIDYENYFNKDGSLLVYDFKVLKIGELYKKIDITDDKNAFKLASEFYNNYSRVHHAGLFTERIIDEFDYKKASEAVKFLYFSLLELCTYLKQGEYLHIIFSDFQNFNSKS